MSDLLEAIRKAIQARPDLRQSQIIAVLAEVLSDHCVAAYREVERASAVEARAEQTEGK